ncbi:alpha/beta fold hydrolase BchO [Roseovarius sp. MMSF_3359]|nr:alpha/beta fold hydrolase BchO [Roseovarius sp. MMSF_3359]
MDWERDLPTWPLNHLSRRITHRAHRWHVQETGTGDTLLLLHGAGASTHTWRDIIPILARSHHVIALDLPGQGFTQVTSRGRHGLQAMARDIDALCKMQNWAPSAIIGHSAGAAVALEMSRLAEDQTASPPAVIGINPALERFDGMAGWLFPLLAKLLALNPFSSYLFAAGRNSRTRARRLIERTGSHLSDEGIDYYARLISDRDHVEGALQMMAQWQIDGLLDRLSSLSTRCLFIVGDKDGAVKPETSETAASRIAQAEVVHFVDLGHLAHEERPDDVTQTIDAWLNR